LEAIVLATKNQGKIREFEALLKPFNIAVKGLDQFPQVGDIPEDGETFEDNARFKAGETARLTGLIAVADDSGLLVDALDGAPGVYSARYAGEPSDPPANNAKLLRELEGVPEEKRTARFVCVMAAATPEGREIWVRGVWEGRIATELSGREGFGYDPLFFDPELAVTAACMAPEVKNARSHRGRAVAALLERWPQFLAQARS
jgi:XTP/dITP diphosphohydrolase